MLALGRDGWCGTTSGRCKFDPRSYSSLSSKIPVNCEENYPPYFTCFGQGHSQTSLILHFCLSFTPRMSASTSMRLLLRCPHLLISVLNPVAALTMGCLKSSILGQPLFFIIISQTSPTSNFGTLQNSLTAFQSWRWNSKIPEATNLKSLSWSILILPQRGRHLWCSCQEEKTSDTVDKLPTVRFILCHWFGRVYLDTDDILSSG